MAIIIREANPGDAEKMIEYTKAHLEEQETFLEMSKGEFTMTIEDEKKFIQDCNNSVNSTVIVAEDNGELIGVLICRGSDREKIKHNTVLGMTVKKECRDKGIGTKLLEYSIKWAGETGVIKRIELYVFENNERAIHLYKKLGFVTEGVKQKAVKSGNEYLNELIMALVI